MRVVSLVPSVTETLLAWDVEPAACTRFCEQPSLLALGGTKDPDVPAIIGLAPDLVVVNDEENRREDAHELEAAGLAIEVLRIRTVDDVAPELARLRARLGLPVEQVEPLPAPVPIRLAAFVPIWKRPWMTMNRDTYASSLLARLGIANVCADHDERFPETTLEDAAARRPDVVMAPSEPYPFAERHRPLLEAVAPVVFVDGKDLFWWGVRTPGAIRRLAQVM